jgi:predicted Zn finger-like uncharacterized protein
MKISCQSCQSKYTIADDKVSGKVVKIRCKKCGATIVVNGSDSSGAGTASYPPEAPAADGAWTVNVAEGDQRTMTDDEIVSAFHSGVVNDETFCWRDGMADWLPLREIEQLSEACGATHAMAAPPAASFAQQPARGANGGAAEPVAAARRVAGRPQGGDLFSAAAQAGGEDDVMTSAPVGSPQARPAPPPQDDKMVGERNENSVLFSLSALTSKGTGPTKPTTPGVEASGLIDIRQLSAQLNSSDDKKKSRIDDIMNLAGGGAFSPSLSGPILSAPSVSEYTAPEEGAAPAAAQGRGRWVVIAAAAAGVLVIVGAIGTATMMMKGKPDAADKDKASASTGEVASASPTSTTTTTASAAASAAPSTSDTAAAAAPSATPAAAPSEPAAPKVAAATATPKASKDTSGGSAPAPKENSLAAAMAGGAAPAPAAPAAAAGGGSEPFNMGEAKARLAAAAAAAQGCKKGDGPSGTGRVVVMFAPSGAAQSATVSGPPFEGTPTGACVAARFRGVHVPAFSGSPFSVSKSFSIN